MSSCRTRSRRRSAREIARNEGDALLLCSREVYRAYPAGELARLVALHGHHAPREIVGALSRGAPERTAAVALMR